MLSLSTYNSVGNEKKTAGNHGEEPFVCHSLASSSLFHRLADSFLLRRRLGFLVGKKVSLSR